MNKNIRKKLIDDNMNLIDCKTCKYFAIHSNRTIACNINHNLDDYTECIIIDKHLKINP